MHVLPGLAQLLETRIVLPNFQLVLVDIAPDRHSERHPWILRQVIGNRHDLGIFFRDAADFLVSRPVIRQRLVGLLQPVGHTVFQFRIVLPGSIGEFCEHKSPNPSRRTFRVSLLCCCCCGFQNICFWNLLLFVVFLCHLLSVFKSKNEFNNFSL